MLQKVEYVTYYIFQVQTHPPCDSLDAQILSVQYRYRDPFLCTDMETLYRYRDPVIPISRPSNTDIVRVSISVLQISKPPPLHRYRDTSVSVLRIPRPQCILFRQKMSFRNASNPTLWLLLLFSFILVTPAINNNTQSNLQQQPVSMQQQVVREPVQAFQSTSQQVMNSGNNLPLYQELPQQVNQIGDNFLFNPQQQVYSTTTCQSNTQQKQPAYSNISFQVMPQQNQQQPQHQGFTNTNFQSRHNNRWLVKVKARVVDL